MVSRNNDIIQQGEDNKVDIQLGGTLQITFAISKSKQLVVQRGNKTFLVSNNQEYEIYRIITVTKPEKG